MHGLATVQVRGGAALAEPSGFTVKSPITAAAVAKVTPAFTLIVHVCGVPTWAAGVPDGKSRPTASTIGCVPSGSPLAPGQKKVTVAPVRSQLIWPPTVLWLPILTM